MSDLRLALRLLARQPTMAGLAVLALALGIGMPTTMFSIVNGAVLRGLPFPESDRILHVAPFDAAEHRASDTRAHTFAELSRRQRSFEALAAFYAATANVVGPDGVPERYRGAWVTPNSFRLLRVAPLLGRDFSDADGRPGAEPAVIIGYRVWRERFSGAADVVGRTLRVNGTPMTVVGVMPDRFAFPQSQDVWPAAVLDSATPRADGERRYDVIGRLAPGVTRDAAAAELAVLWRQLAAEFPADYPGSHTLEVKPYVERFLGRETIAALYTMLAAVSLVMLIACANVANLVLARAAGRARELALRAAIGASRSRIVRQMLAEVLVLSLLGAGLGLALARLGVALFNRAIIDTSPPFWLDIRIDASVLGFVSAAALGSALAAGLLPAWRASRAELAAVLGDEGRVTGLRVTRLSRGLVVAQLALSFGLLLVSGLMIRSIVNLGRVDYGFAMADVLTARLALPDSDYPGDGERRRLQQGLVERLAALPGVEGAALATVPPPSAPPQAIRLPGQAYPDERYPLACGVSVSPDYFAVLRVTLLEGRGFDRRDGEGGPAVAIVDRAFARRHFPGGALGRQFALARGAHQEWRTIVGVAPDLGAAAAGRGAVKESFYLPLGQAPEAVVSILLDASGPPLALSSAVRQAVRELDPNLPIFGVHTLAGLVHQQAWGFRVFGTLFSAFGAAALFLATVGLYGVMSFSVSRRLQEFGVRMALGASGRELLRLVLRQGLRQVAVGVVLGAGIGIALASALRLLLFQVSPFDPAMLVGIAGVLAASGLLACLVPARRAGRVDPMVTLRCQ